MKSIRTQLLVGLLQKRNGCFYPGRVIFRAPYEESFCNHEQFITKWDVCVYIMNAHMHFHVSLPLSKISYSCQFGSVQDVHKLYMYLRNTVWVGLYHKCAAHSLYKLTGSNITFPRGLLFRTPFGMSTMYHMVLIGTFLNSWGSSL